jgi:hypothetical protein
MWITINEKAHVDIGHVGPSTCHMVSEVLIDKTTQLLLTQVASVEV